MYEELVQINKSKLYLNEEFHKIFSKREDSIIIDLFHSQICSTFICTNCSYQTYSFEKILDLPLLIGHDFESKCNCTDLLDDFFKEDVIDWENTCIQCRKRANHNKVSRISKLPTILILTFQRYNPWKKIKNEIVISFDETVNLRRYLDKDCLIDMDTNYTLKAISNHSGILNFGHYFT